MTQGGTLPPNIFNVVVEVVVRHWASLVAEGETGPERWGMEIQRRAAFSHAGDGLIVSTQMECPQGAFEDLTGLFNRVGLRMNVGKKVGMMCQIFCGGIVRAEDDRERDDIQGPPETAGPVPGM